MYIHDKIHTGFFSVSIETLSISLCRVSAEVVDPFQGTTSPDASCNFHQTSFHTEMCLVSECSSVAVHVAGGSWRCGEKSWASEYRRYKSTYSYTNLVFMCEIHSALKFRAFYSQLISFLKFTDLERVSDKVLSKQNIVYMYLMVSVLIYLICLQLMMICMTCWKRSLI